MVMRYPLMRQNLNLLLNREALGTDHRREVDNIRKIGLNSIVFAGLAYFGLIYHDMPYFINSS